jgi:ribonuclease-3
VVRPTDALRLPGYDFVDPGLLAQALTHRSAASLHNERLEFLGDALVNLIVAEALYHHWPKADEGTLTRARAELVRESSLAADRAPARPRRVPGARSRRNEVGRPSPRFDPGRRRRSHHRCDPPGCGLRGLPRRDPAVFEPLIAALPPPNKLGKDAKTRLQEWLQGRQKPLPVYRLIAESGDEHAKQFTVACTVSDPPVECEGEGSSRRAAEQSAAERRAGDDRGLIRHPSDDSRWQAPAGGRIAPMDTSPLPRRPRRRDRPPERGQVDPRQRARRLQDQHHLQPPADHAPSPARHRDVPARDNCSSSTPPACIANRSAR